MFFFSFSLFSSVFHRIVIVFFFGCVWKCGFFLSIFTFNLIFRDVFFLSWLMLLMGFPLFGYTAFISHFSCVLCALPLSVSFASLFISLENTLFFLVHLVHFFPHILFRTGATLAKAEGMNVTLIQIDSWAFNLLFKVISHRVKLENDCECNSFELMKDNRSKLSKFLFFIFFS